MFFEVVFFLFINFHWGSQLHKPYTGKITINMSIYSEKIYSNFQSCFLGHHDGRCVDAV